MHDFHTNRTWYFEMQTLNTARYVIPFIEETYSITPGMNVLEVGCGEGGVLKAFVDKGCHGVGVDLDKIRIEMAEEYLAKEISEGKMAFYFEDIYNPTFASKFANKFDLIVLKDVIEHIPNQELIMNQFKNYLTESGRIYFGFPPFNMPFGGHQQIAVNPIFSKIPYTHLLPMSLYKMLLKLFHEAPEQFVEIKETGISTARFERICRNLNYTIENKTHFLINPIYEYKFGLKPRKQFSLISKIPFLRDYATTCAYYLIRK